MGSTADLLARADVLASGDAAAQQRALHLVDFVIFAGGDDVEAARRRKADLLDARAEAEPSFVASNVLRSAATLERDRLNPS